MKPMRIATNVTMDMGQGSRKKSKPKLSRAPLPRQRGGAFQLTNKPLWRRMSKKQKEQEME